MHCPTRKMELLHPLYHEVSFWSIKPQCSTYPRFYIASPGKTLTLESLGLWVLWGYVRWVEMYWLYWLIILYSLIHGLFCIGLLLSCFPKMIWKRYGNKIIRNEGILAHKIFPMGLRARCRPACMQGCRSRGRAVKRTALLAIDISAPFSFPIPSH